MKLFKQILRAVIVSLLLLVVVVPVTVYVVVSTPWAQEKIRSIAVTELSEKLGTEVSIGKVLYHPFNTVQLESVSVNDDNGRCALSVGRVAARFELWHFLRSGKFIFDYALLDALDARIYRASPSAPLNIAGIIERLQSKDKTKPPTQFDLRISTVVVSNASLHYDVLDQPATPQRFNPNHLAVTDLQLYAYLRNASPHGVDLLLDELSLREQSGFELTALTADVAATDSLIELRSLSASLPQSHLALQPISLRINGFSDIVPAARAATLRLATAGDAYVSTADLAAFVPALADVPRTAKVRCALTSAPDCITIDSLVISDDLGSEIALEATVNQPFNADSLNAYVNVVNATVTADELRAVSAYLPRNAATLLARLGTARLSATVTADMTHADATATVRAAGATVTVDAGATTADCFRHFDFDATAAVDHLPVGTLMTVPDLGAVSLTIDADGSYAGRATSAEVTAAVRDLTYRGYTYSDINIDGEFDGRMHQLAATIVSDDPNADFDLGFTLDNTDVRRLNLALQLHRLDLNALQLSSSYPDYALSGDVRLDAAMHDNDHIYGELAARDLQLRAADPERNSLAMRNFEVTVAPNSPDSVTTAITIASDYLNGSITGQFTPSTLPAALSDMAAHVVPDLIPYDAARHARVAASPNLFDIDLTLANVEDLCNFLHLPVQPIYPIDIRGSVDGAGGSALISIDAPYLRQGDNIIDSSMLAAAIDASTNTATIYATTHTPTKKGPMNVVLGVRGADNTFRTSIDWEIERAVPINGTINFATTLSRSDGGEMCATTDFHPGQINFGDDIWHISPSTVTWCDKTITVDDFAMHTETQHISIDGVGSASVDDVMNVELSNIHLISIFETLGIDNALISGTATGSVQARALLSSIPVLTTDNIHVDQVGYNYCTVGDADVRANWDNDNKAFYIDADIVNAQQQHSRIYGNIYAASSALDLNFEVTHAPVGFMLPFMSAFTSAIDGYVSGNAHLFGTFKDIDMEGDVFAEDLRLKIDFTNCWYSATDSIHVSPGRIRLDDIVIRDVDGHTAHLSGDLYHQYFHYPEFDFQITDARDFLCYNVSAKQSDLWYGTIYGNGTATVKGRPGVVEIGANMTTAPHSTFTFVLSDQLEAQEYSFINFRDATPRDTVPSVLAVDNIPQAVKDYQQRMLRRNVVKPSDYVMDITVDVTPDAEMIVVMDPIGGDRIRAFGNGNIRMAYNSADNDVYLWGLYTLDHGKYNFTLQDIIIKDFTINKGSSIEFKGDPYSATLNIEAIYQLNANLSDLDESFTQDKDLNRTNVPVQAVMIVTDDMRQPDIRFDLKFPTLNADVYRKVRSIVSTDDMMNRQIIYLLALNRFYTPDYMAQTSRNNELFSVASSTISSQLSSMLGKLSDNWSIAPNLRSDQGDFSDLEVDLALSSRLLNNRLLFNGNFGYRDKSLNSNQFVGDFDIEYLLTPSGNWRLKAYNRYNDQNYYLRTATTTQGIGIMFRHDFDNLFRRGRKPEESDQSQRSDSIPSDSIINTNIPDSK